MAAQYAEGADERNPLVSPAFGDFAAFPPLLAIAGGDEVLLDDTLSLVRSAGVAGTDATAYVAAGMQHIFPVFAGAFPEADAGVRVIGDWIARRA